MDPTASPSSDSQPSQPETPQRHFPIKGLIIFLVAAQPVLVAISLYYTEVVKKDVAKPLCDPALHAALEHTPLIPSSDYYKNDAAAQQAYEEGWLIGYRQTAQAMIDAGCNADPSSTLSAYAAPVGTVEAARANGRNDGALSAQHLPRECLNQCWRLVIRRPVPQTPVK